MHTNAKSVKSLNEEAERNAQKIRSAAGYSLSEIVSPFDLATRLGYLVLSADDLLRDTDTDLAERVGELSAKQWSALGIPNAKLIIYNSKQTDERRNASIMEEVAHFFLGHAPTVIGLSNELGSNRTFDDCAERIAYWTGAAVLVPASELSRAIWRGQNLSAIAHDRAVSVELVEFRAKVLGLWQEVVHESAA